VPGSHVSVNKHPPEPYAGVRRASPSSAQWATPNEAPDRRGLFLLGAQLWAVYRITCHNARRGGEFSPAEWQMIIMHLRTQANLTPNDSRATPESLQQAR